MPIAKPLSSRRTLLTLVCWLTAANPAALQSQGAPGASPGGIEDVRDLTLSAGERQRFTGLFEVESGDPAQPSMSIRFSEGGNALIGQVGDNEPTRMLYQGGNIFRPEAATEFVITFVVEADRATRFTLVTPQGTMEGVRITEQGGAASFGRPGSAVAGSLHEDLARMDSLLFTAAYDTCDPRAVEALLTDDIEFYHDQTGFHSGAQVRADFQRLTEDCPLLQGVTREIVAGSLAVYPISEYGAVQMGDHRFVRSDGADRSVVVARFVHLWKKMDGSWRLARVMSFDHRGAGSPDGGVILQP